LRQSIFPQHFLINHKNEPVRPHGRLHGVVQGGDEIDAVRPRRRPPPLGRNVLTIGPRRPIAGRAADQAGQWRGGAAAVQRDHARGLPLPHAEQQDEAFEIVELLPREDAEGNVSE